MGNDRNAANGQEPTLGTALEAIDKLAASTAKGFEGVNQQFGPWPRGFDQLETRVDTLDTKFNTLAGNYAELSENVKKLTDTKVSYTEFNNRLRPIEQNLGIPSPQR
jgi:hypothetical protein